ncbi:prepilin peptidase [Brenneria goodwinii]|uniref:Prepilin leader peptidase/N-methyltransferase n=1 Tax=Brenneria goodwinii TaxID=1109412 RepID=A0AAE8EVF2_9GAMM|nr:A24 family peptidase [Brenneria goodwinii]ATA23761.1 prepilin peptidase [Brenneria goodwinii]RLM28517.1 prepilin peptidase [Brenneria goodwinii]
MEQLTALSAAYPLGWLVTLALLGLIVGSFLNVVIYRLPQMLERRWRDEALRQLGSPLSEPAPRYDLLLPPSACPHCRQPIAARDNIPLVSWLLLRGRARCCRHRIPWRYPLVELAGMVVFVLAGRLTPVGWELVGVLLFLSGLLTLAVIDARTWLLPDVVTLPLLWLGIGFNLSDTFVPLSQAVVGAMAGYLSLWCLLWGCKLLKGKDGLGYGDLKLFAALGAWLGWQALPHLILIAAGGGVLVTLIHRRITRQSVAQPLAFGPWLALGGAVSMVLQITGVTGIDY